MKAIVEFEGKKYEAKLTEIVQEKESKVWKPKKADTYYHYTGDGDCSSSIWCEDNVDISRYLFGNCFRTEQECQDAVEVRKTEVELMRYAKEHNGGEIDWENGDQQRYHICINHDSGLLIIDCDYCYERAAVYFTSKQIAKSAIKEIGEERIKKYIKLKGMV